MRITSNNSSISLFQKSFSCPHESQHCHQLEEWRGGPWRWSAAQQWDGDIAEPRWHTSIHMQRLGSPRSGAWAPLCEEEGLSLLSLPFFGADWYSVCCLNCLTVVIFLFISIYTDRKYYTLAWLALSLFEEKEYIEGLVSFLRIQMKLGSLYLSFFLSFSYVSISTSLL